MNEFNQKHAYDNFDREFNRSGKKNSAMKRFPRWLLGVLAGALLVGGGIARNHLSQPQTIPAALPAAESREQVVIPTSDDTVSAQAAVHNISTGDEQANSDEFAAVMASKNGKSIVLPPKTVCTVQDTNYNVSVEELPVGESGEAVVTTQTETAADDSVVVWIEQTPFRIHFEKTSEIPAGNISSAEELPVIQIDGHSYALHMEPSAQEAGGASDNPTFNLNEQPIRISVEDLENQSTAKGNWFVQVFHSLFGENEPTAIPTVIQVTVVTEAAATATSVPTDIPTDIPTDVPTIVPTAAQDVQPTAAAAAAASAPVRLDAKSVESDLQDAPLYFDDDSEEESEEDIHRTASMPSDAVATLASGTAIPVYINDTGEETGSTPIPVLVKTIAPEAPLNDTGDELPETGMAEDWNIPMMLAAAAGLLGIIILSRRLRRKG